jgi:hypothetical protein
MGTIQIDGSTPKITVGNATAEDATILFDGNAKDFYIALDDSEDDLVIGLGSTVGTTPAIAIDENLKVNIPVTTASTSASTGSLTTGGGAGIGADLYVGDDAYLITDSAVLGFGADKDTLLTHTDGTGLTLNSTNKLCFNDASQFVQGISATVLGLGATDEIDLTATAIDINGTCDISGTFSLGGTNMTATAAELNLLDGGTSVGSSITLADADGIIVNDGGTMKTIPASDISTYAGGGKLLQVQAAKFSSETSVTSTTATATEITDQITCAATSSKVLVLVSFAAKMYEGSGTANTGRIILYRDVGSAGYAAIYGDETGYMSNGSYDAGTAISTTMPFCLAYLDSPSSTSALDYKIYIRLDVASGSGDNITTGASSMDSTITLMEIGA